MSRPIFVAISDIHFTLNTLELATAALQAAINTSNELGIPLVIAGDLHDSKAIIRAEVANRLLELLPLADQQVFIIVGNHDLINEKDMPHGLNYLRNLATVVDHPTYLNVYTLLLPYYSKFPTSLDLPNTKILVCHQGFQGAAMGDYIVDKSSTHPKVVKDFAVISGHYHKHQTIGTQLGQTHGIGTITYIGSPYTITFGEANDGPKGFLVVNEDGSFTREILDLRKHIKLDVSYDTPLGPTPGISPNDLLWLTIRGPESELTKLNKVSIGTQLLGHSNFKLDLIPTESTQSEEAAPKKMTNEELFVTIIDDSSETPQQKQYLKDLFYEVTAS